MGTESVPGKDPGIKSRVLEVGTSLLQKFAPTKKISQHVCAFHFYAHDMTRQVGARLSRLRKHAWQSVKGKPRFVCRPDNLRLHCRGTSLLLLRQ